MKKLTLLFLIVFTGALFAQKYAVPFYANGTYNESIPKPGDITGYDLGDRPIDYGNMVQYITKLAEVSPLVKLYSEGQTHQGRKLYYMVITSEENHKNIDQIKAGLAKLSDPRTTNDNEAKSIIENSPSIALMMYSIHGNEASGTDAGIQLAYQLAAGTDETTKQILNDLVVIIYPMENPDGRMRFLSQMENWQGKIINSDVQSMPQSGVWPSGRTNHYHFDLNRDWFILSQPESRARVKLVHEFNPQLVVDAHEMGSFSSFLFNPPREPINPYMDIRIRGWWKVFADDQAKAIDQYGWSYYTREWLEEWYPGYGSSYPSYFGAISILYEQARTSGQNVKRPDGTTLTFAESVHHQFVSSVANLKTLRANKQKYLNDYYNMHKDAVNKGRKDNIKYFIIDPGKNLSRVAKLVEILNLHGIEMYKAEQDFSVNDAVNYYGEKASGKFSTGSLIIPVAQPSQALINVMMEFDTRMDNAFLKSERESLLKGEGTRLYEVSAWSLPIAFDVETYTSKSELSVKKELIKSLSTTGVEVVNKSPKYGYLIEYADDAAVKTLIALFDKNIKVRSANKPFSVEGAKYERGTLLIRLNENPGIAPEVIEKTASDNGIKITGVNTALSEKGSDLGADEFPLLTAPAVAMLAGTSIGMGNYGAMMHLFDNDLGLRVSSLYADNLSRYDLRKYNVLIVPSFYGGGARFKEMIGASGLKKLKDWVSDGGTLIAIAGSAAALADTSVDLSKVSLRPQAISKLESFNDEYRKEQEIKNVSIDSLSIWENKEDKTPVADKKKEDKPEVKKLAEADREAVKFMPQGAIVKLDLNEEHWLNFGLSGRVPAIYTTNDVFLSKKPVETAARLADKKQLRLSGLIWPEAADRMATAAYLTRESSGSGQVILFADEPNFRSYFEGTERLLLNSILLGPGFGTRQTVAW